MRTDDGPHVLVYNETTVDGRITGYAGYAGDPGRYYRLGFRWPSDAILMGSVTAEAFGPAESAPEQASVLPPLAPAAIPPGFEELVREPRPLLVVPDSTGRVRCWRHAQAQPWYRGIVVLVCETTPAEYLTHLDHRGIEHLRVGGERVDLGLALRLLHERYRVRTVRTDGGGSLTGALLAAGVVDELALLVLPVVAGDPDALPLVRLPHTLDDAGVRLGLTVHEVLEDGALLLVYRVQR